MFIIAMIEDGEAVYWNEIKAAWGSRKAATRYATTWKNLNYGLSWVRA